MGGKMGDNARKKAKCAGQAPGFNIELFLIQRFDLLNIRSIFSRRFSKLLFEFLAEILPVVVAYCISYFIYVHFLLPQKLCSPLQTDRFQKVVDRQIGYRFELLVQYRLAHPDFFGQNPGYPSSPR